MEKKGLGAFGTLLRDLMADHAVLAAFNHAPEAVMTKRGLTPSQQKALSHRDAPRIDEEFAKENPHIAALAGYSDGGLIRAQPSALEGLVGVAQGSYIRAAELVQRLASGPTTK